MENFLAVDLKDVPYLLVALLIAFGFHEFAHAYTAYRLGDTTPKEQGRLTVLPHKHLDPIGFIMVFIAGFGWAKPVEVNPLNFSKPRRDDILVSLAGPAANLLIVAFSFLIWYGAIGLGIGSLMSDNTYEIIYNFFDQIVFLNITLFIFNLLPIPPLDGYHIFKNLFLPKAALQQLEENQAITGVLFLILVLTPIGDVIFNPIFDTVVPAVYNIFDTPLTKIFGLS